MLIVSDPGCVAEFFSDYFANIIQLEHRSDTDYTDHPSVKAISNLRFSSELITPQSVLHISVTFWTTLIRERQLGRRHFTTNLAFGIPSSCRKGD